MQAIILAAGSGRRLKTVLGNRPKCLVSLGDCLLIDYQISVLHALGIDEICVVCGYLARDVCACVADRCTCMVINRRFDQTNSLYSLSLARHWVSGAFVLINGDVLAAPGVFERLLEKTGSAVAYDSASGHDKEQMKVMFRNARLTSISKTMTPSHADGESLGLLKFDAVGAACLFKAVEADLKVAGPNQWAPAAVNRMAAHHRVEGVDVRGLPWVEIDFPVDLDYAIHHVWPAINARSVMRSPSTRRNRMSNSCGLTGRRSSAAC